MRFITFFSILVTVFLCMAGPNEDAELFFDFTPSTDDIDEKGGCLVDSTFTTSVKVKGASNLYSYQLYVSFDTASLEYISAKAGSDELTTMLEKNGGTSFLTPKISKDDKTKLMIGCSLLGSESDQCVSDDGLLCLLKFKHKKDDTTELAISSVIFEDCDETSDNTLNSSKGILLPEILIPVIQSARKRVLSPEVVVRNGSVSVQFNKKTEYVLTVVNTLGKKVYSHKGFSETARFDSFQAGNKKYSSGLFVVMICSLDNKLIIPLVQ